MQNSTPEKILGKKFVRGKPYYKIKWEGVSKEQSTWEAPSTLKKFKVMINKYEIKNWGAPLDDKFFDSDLYLTKAFAPKKKTQDKKKIKELKREDKRKLKQESSSSSELEEEESQEEVEVEDPKKQTLNKLNSIQPLNPKPPITKNNINSELQIIDLDAQILQINKVAEKQTLAKKQNKIICPFPSQIAHKLNTQSNININSINTNTNNINNINVNEISSSNVVPILQNSSIEIFEKQRHKNLGLTIQQQISQQLQNNNNPNDNNQNIPRKQRTNEQQQKQKNLSYCSAICVEIEPMKKIKRIVHIYHLEKVNMGNHLYLVQFQDKQMAKMTTDQMLEKHPQELVNFLQMKFKNKCLISV